MIWDFEQFSLISFKIAFSCLVDLTKLNSIKIQKKHHQSLCSSPSHPPTPYVCVCVCVCVCIYIYIYIYIQSRFKRSIIKICVVLPHIHPPHMCVCVYIYISFVVTTYRCTTRKVTYRDMFLVVAKNFHY